MKKEIFSLTVLLIIFAVLPSPVMGETITSGTEYSYSFVHLSDTQGLVYYPSTYNLTFTRIQSLKSTYNISAIFITGDLTDKRSLDPISGDYPRYLQAIAHTTIPVYEISGNHDLYDIEGNYTLWDKYVPDGKKKHDYGFVFNNFIVYGLGWNNGTSVNPTTKAAMQSALSNNPSKVPLILTHAYFMYKHWTEGERDPIGYDILDALPRNSIILTGHQHSNVTYGFIRQTEYNDITIIEDLINYQDWLNYSGGRLYNITSNGSRITRITVSDLHLYPGEIVVNNTVTYTIFHQSLPDTEFSANPTSGTAPLTVKFTDTSTNSPTSWRWAYKNATVGWRLFNTTSPTPSFTFAAGTYDINLTTTNDAGSDDEIKIGYITVMGPGPVANFTASPRTGTSPLSVSFTDTSMNSPTSWKWAYKNATVGWTQFAATKNTSFIFAAGTYDINLTVTNFAGSNTFTIPAYIYVPTTGAQLGVGVFRPAAHTFYLKNGTITTTINWGASTDLPVTGDWNGDGRTDVGVYRPAVHTFYLKNGTITTAINWGASTDLPVTGDWNGDRITDVGVYRPSAHTFYLKNGTTTTINWGVSTDLPVTGDWNGDRITDVGVFRPSSHTFYLKNGTITTAINWGISTDLPVTGKWS